jgi:hypothetical protein
MAATSRQYQRRHEGNAERHAHATPHDIPPIELLSP